MVRKMIIMFVVGMFVAACGQPGASSPTAPPIITPAANTVPMDATAPAGEPLVVLTHDSFAVSEDVLAAFEQETGATVQVLRGGDAGTMLNQAVLSRSAPVADVIFGVDNTFLSRALEADILEPYASPALADIPAELQLDPSNRMLPVDYGYVVINYDPATLEAEGLTPPTRLEDLTAAEWRGKLAVQNPATSSPGLAFLLATIAHFGTEGEYTWEQYWADLRANEVYIGNDWTDVYYSQFSGSSGQGPYPLAVSYATSPAAEVFFSEGALETPPTANLFVPGGSFRQIEFVGILKGTDQQALAERFVDFMLQPTFQADIPLQMFVYPANPQAALPEVFTQFAAVPEQTAELDPATIEAERDNWIQRWTEIVLR